MNSNNNNSQNNTPQSKTSGKSLNKMIYATLFAALIGICSQIIIPLPFIPINMALFAVFMSGICLGPIYGALSVIIYCLLGLVGVPVFAGFNGGIHHLIGITGGFIIGYIFTAFITGLLICTKKSGTKPTPFRKLRPIIAMSLGLLSCYTIGTLWFMFVTDYSIKATLIYCVLPFIPGDIVKIALALVLARKLRSFY